MQRRANQGLVRHESLQDFQDMVSPFEEPREEPEASRRVVRLKPRAPSMGLLGMLLGTTAR